MDHFLPGSASLVDCVDKKLLVTLRTGKHLIGILRTYDQFANLVLQNTVERIIIDGKMAEVYIGMMVIRGENVSLLGQVDPVVEQRVVQGLHTISEQEAQQLMKSQAEARKLKEQARLRILQQHGFSMDAVEQDTY